MNNFSWFLFYWALCLVLWWVFIGRKLSRRWAELSWNGQSGDRGERIMILLLVVLDFAMAPLFVPMELVRRVVEAVVQESKFQK